jgi:hypothetical protein
MVRILLAKFTGVPDTRLAVVALVILLVSADANTSAGAPAVSWVTRSEDPAKLNVTVDPGFSVWKIVPISVNVAFSDAAANTVNVPAAAGAEAAALDGAAEPTAFELDADPGELAAEELAAAAVVDVAVVLPELQLTTRVATQSVTRAESTPRSRVVERGRVTSNLQEFR